MDYKNVLHSIYQIDVYELTNTIHCYALKSNKNRKQFTRLYTIEMQETAYDFKINYFKFAYFKVC